MADSPGDDPRSTVIEEEIEIGQDDIPDAGAGAGVSQRGMDQATRRSAPRIVRELDSAAGMPPMREPRAGMEIGVEPESTGPLTDGISELGRGLARHEGQLEFKVQRLEPSDLPAGELGWMPWIRPLMSNAKEDDILDIIAKRYGGGAYEIRVRSLDKQRPQEFSTIVRLGGPWYPMTYEGRTLWMARYPGSAAPVAEATAGGALPSPVPTGMDPAAGGAFGFAGKAMEQIAEERKHLQTLRAQSEMSTNELLMKMLLLKEERPQPQQRQPLDIEKIVAAVSAGVTLANTLIIAPMREARVQRDAIDRQRHDQMMALVSQRQEAKTPQEALAATQAILEVYKENTKMELGLKGEFLKTLMLDTLKGAGVQPSNPLWDAVKSVGAEVGPDLVKGVLDYAKRKLEIQATGGRAAPPPPPPPPPGAPQLPQQAQQPQQQPQQRAGYPAGVGPLPPGTTIWGQPAPDQPAPAGGQPPPPPPTAAAAPAPGEAPPPPHAVLPAVPMPSSFDTLAEQGRAIAYDALDQVLSTFVAFAENKPDAESFWDYPVPQTGRTTTGAWHLCPMGFRERMKEIAADPKRTISFAWLCEGILSTDVQRVAADIDRAAATTDKDLYAWLRSILDYRPWDAEPDEEPEEPHGA